MKEEQPDVDDTQKVFGSIANDESVQDKRDDFCDDLSRQNRGKLRRGALGRRALLYLQEDVDVGRLNRSCECRALLR